jgi:hypothetical protein
MKFKNPWSEKGKLWPPKWMKVESTDSDAAFYGGEVTNHTDTSWLISGVSNSNKDHFIWLLPNSNSDDMLLVHTELDGDVDAVWPAGRRLKNSQTGEVVTSGAFKLTDLRNTEIVGKSGDYTIKNFSTYFSDDELPSGWRLPDKFRK